MAQSPLAMAGPRSPRSSNVSSLVAASPDVNINDYQVLQGPSSAVPITNYAPHPHRFHTNLSLDHNSASLSRPGSCSDLVSLADTRNSRSGANVSGLEDHPLPMLTTLQFSASSSTSKAAANAAANPGEGGTSGSTPVTAGAPGMGGSHSPSTSLAGRSMTLLERRNNRERSALSLSCLSGLNVERLQEGMRDSGEAPHPLGAPAPQSQGWSKTVASAALLSEYAMPTLMPRAPCSAPARDSAPPSANTTAAAAGVRPSTGQYGNQAARAVAGPDAEHAPRRGLAGVTGTVKTVDSVPGALKVIGYNILASRLVSNDLYPSCAPSVLGEEYRLNLLKGELARVDPDILMLEEVSVAVHEQLLGPYLKSTLGLEGHHVVITDRDGVPRCRPAAAVSPMSRVSAASSGGLATPPSLLPAHARRKPSSAGLVSASATGVTVSPAAAATTGNMSTLVMAELESNNSFSHLPQLAKSSSSRPSSRCGSGGGPSSFTRFPGGSGSGSGAVTSTPAIRPKRDEMAAHSPLRRQITPPQILSSSSIGDTTVSPEATTNEDSMQRSYSAIEFTHSASTRAKRRSSTRLLRPSVSGVLAAGGGGGGAGAAATAAAELAGHRRVEMDGVGIYYKASRFRVLEVVPIMFNRLAAADKRLTRYEHTKLQVSSHNVALVVVLHDTQVTSVTRIYVVAAVHLIWQRVNAQLWQAHHLLRVVEELKQKYTRGIVDPVLPGGRGAMGAYGDVTTQPPSTIETPLTLDSTRRGTAPEEGSPALQPVPTAPLPPAMPRTPSARRLSVALSRTTGEHSDTAGDGSVCTSCSFGNNMSLDRHIFRRTSVSTSGMGWGPATVTCIIGGDFNSERSGPVMEYLRTGRVPREAEVMEYWRAPQSASPAPLEHTDQRPTASPVPLAEDFIHGDSTTASVPAITAAAMKAGAAAAVALAAPPPPGAPTRGRGGPLGELLPTPPPLPQTPSPPAPPLHPAAAPARFETLPSPHAAASRSPLSSIGSPPSPTQPSLRPRRGTQSPVPADDDIVGALAAAAMVGGGVKPRDDGAYLLRPCTPPRSRPPNLYTTRSADVVLSPLDTRMSGARGSAVEQTPAAPNSPGRGGAAAAARASPGRGRDPPMRHSLTSGFCFNRGCSSITPSPMASSLADTAKCVGGSGSVPTLAVGLASQHVRSAVPVSLSNSHSPEVTPLLAPPPSLPVSKLVQAGALPVPAAAAPVNAVGSRSFSSRTTSPPAWPMSEAAASSSATPAAPRSYSRRVTSPDVLNLESGSPDHSRSYSVSECGSVLSAAVAPGCAMRLALHNRHGTPSIESAESGLEGAESRHRSLLSGPPTAGTPSAYPSPSQEPISGWSGSVPMAHSADRARLSVLGVLSPTEGDIVAGAAVNRAGGLRLGSLAEEMPRAPYGDLATPASPRARTKRRPAGGTASATAPAPPTPQASRRGTVAPLSPTLGTPTEVVVAALPTAGRGLEKRSAEQVCTPATPPRPLVDEVTHAIRFSDAYAPYCYRHPTRVSAVNPSTNMEGKVLDHILYEDEHVVCGAVLRLGERQELPNAQVPSDHYMVGSVLVPLQELHQD